MNNLSYKISQNFKATSKKGEDVALFFNESLMKEFLLTRSKKNININVVKNRREAKSVLNNIGTSKISTLFTDSKYLFSSNHEINSYLIMSKKTNIDFSIIDNENFLNKQNISKINFNYKVSKEKNITNEIRSNGRRLKKIFYMSGNDIKLALKINGLWKIYDKNELSLFFLLKNNIKPECEEDVVLPEILKTNKNFYNNINYDGHNINFSDTEKFILKLSKWISDDYFYYDICEIINEKGNFLNINNVVKLNEDERFEEFINKTKNNINIKGIEYTSIKQIGDKKFILKTKNGYYVLEKKMQKLYITAFQNSNSSEYDLKKFANATMLNIIYWINNVKKKNTFSKKDIFKVSFGFLLFIILVYSTFSLLFSMGNLSQIFSYLFSKDNLLDPWIYFIIIAFIFSFMKPMIVAVFIQKIIVKGKLNKERLVTYYIAATFRSVASFLTGNYILSVFVWGWYLNRKLEIKTTSIVGAIGFASVFRAIVFFFIGTIFMIAGTSSFFIKYNNFINKKIIWLFLISWIGFVWELFHKTWIFLLLLIPSLQVFVGNTILRLKSFWKTTSNKDYNNMYQNILLMRKTSPNISWQKHRVRFIRAIILVSLPIIIESIETVLYFDLVDSFALRSSDNFNLFKPYYNFIDMSGLRLVASNIHNFPLFRLLPGRGMFISEFGLNSLYEIVYSNAHGDQAGIWGIYTSSDLAQMTTFLTRLFNVYIPMLIRMIIVIVVLLSSILRRKK